MPQNRYWRAMRIQAGHPVAHVAAEATSIPSGRPIGPKVRPGPSPESHDPPGRQSGRTYPIRGWPAGQQARSLTPKASTPSKALGPPAPTCAPRSTTIPGRPTPMCSTTRHPPLRPASPPRPDLHSDHQLPDLTAPTPRHESREAIDPMHVTNHRGMINLTSGYGRG